MRVVGNDGPWTTHVYGSYEAQTYVILPNEAAEQPTQNCQPFQQDVTSPISPGKSILRSKSFQGLSTKDLCWPVNDGFFTLKVDFLL